jgi:hypothetical protein
MSGMGAQMAKPRSTGKRVAGGSASALSFGAGVSTAAVTTDQDVIQALITFLEDRRVLFNPEYLEVASEVDHSVEDMRKELTEALQQVDRKSPAVAPLRALRAACRRYLDNPRQEFRHIGRHDGRDGRNEPGFFVALGELRAIFGHELKLLDDLFDLDVEPQLHALFPSIDEP